MTSFLHTDATDLVGLVFAVFRELCPEDIARGLLCPRLLVKIFTVTGQMRFCVDFKNSAALNANMGHLHCLSPATVSTQAVLKPRRAARRSGG